MSTSVMAACWPLQLPPTPKAVLISLADNANDHGECWPSISTICTRTCFGRTAVIDAIAWLEEHHLLLADRSNGRHTRYRILVSLDLFAGAKAVRVADRSGRRTGARPEPHPSASRTTPVREADTNRQEPSGTKEQQRDSSRGTRLPDDWIPSPELRAWARASHPGVNIDEAAAEFCDYWRAEPGARGLKLDWDATFRVRVRELARRRPAPFGAPAPAPAPSAAKPYVPPPRESAADAFRVEVAMFDLQLERGQIDAATHAERVQEARTRMQARAGPPAATSAPATHVTH